MKVTDAHALDISILGAFIQHAKAESASIGQEPELCVLKLVAKCVTMMPLPSGAVTERIETLWSTDDPEPIDLDSRLLEALVRDARWHAVQAVRHRDHTQQALDQLMFSLAAKCARASGIDEVRIFGRVREICKRLPTPMIGTPMHRKDAARAKHG